jgi:hypothetical protein
MALKKAAAAGKVAGLNATRLSGITDVIVR